MDLKDINQNREVSENIASDQKIALITGISGQDGAYLASLLLSKNYKVFGTYRGNTSQNFWRLEELKIRTHPNLHLIAHDLTNLSATRHLLEKIDFSEIYHLAAPSFVGLSLEQPYTTMQTTTITTLNLLEAIRLTNSKLRFCQASSSEMFGKSQIFPQTETTPFYPRNPYSIAKLYAHFATINYRETYNIFACSAILFNHESPLRGSEFVTRKITQAVAKLKEGSDEPLELGNVNAKRDWGYAEEYVQGMYSMLQANEPDTYILATNRSESVRRFVELAFEAGEMPIEWRGEKEEEIAIDTTSGKIVVKINPKFYRPVEINLLIGNPKKAKEKLGWETKTSLEILVRMMVSNDIKRCVK